MPPEGNRPLPAVGADAVGVGGGPGEDGWTGRRAAVPQKGSLTEMLRTESKLPLVFSREATHSSFAA
jgi:hypothetical protein